MNIKTNRASLLVAMLAGAMALSGCASTLRSMTPNFAPLEGKVLRVTISEGRVYARQPELETPGVVSTKLYRNGNPLDVALYGGDVSDTHAEKEEVIPYRWTLIQTPGLWKEDRSMTGPTSAPFLAIAADSVPLLKVGDWVDVYVPPTSSFSARRHTFITVVRLVCTVEDTACQKREKAAIGEPQGQLVQPKGSFDWASVRITPHYTLDGRWLPGKQLERPRIVTAE